MKYYFYISILFLLSCSAEKWRFEDCRDCDVLELRKTYHSPNDDYIIEIPVEWSTYYHYNDSSNVVFGSGLESSQVDTNNITLAGVYKHYGGDLSDPKREHRLGMEKLKKDYPSLDIIEYGETDILGFHSYYIHTVEPVKNKPDNIDLFFQILNDTDSCYYILQAHCMANGNEHDNICLMTDMFKTFKMR